MEQSVNILFLGGAKRVPMARMLVKAGAALGLEVNIFSYELSAQVPVAEVATVVEGVRWSDPDLMPDLHNVVRDNRIDIMLPFVDPAVEVAARFCRDDRNSECFTPGCNAELAAMMFDKIKADRVFRERGFPVPAEARAVPADGMVIAKPRCGSASKGLRVMTHQDYLKFAGQSEAREFLCQEFVERRKEYTVDCYADARGEFVCAVPRERLEVQGGEVTVTETLHDSEIEELSRQIVVSLGFTGPVTIQFMREVLPDGTYGRLMLMEINPRLGGGAVCAVHAGADLPMFILQDWQGKNVKPCTDWREGVRICRYMQEVVFAEGRKIHHD